MGLEDAQWYSVPGWMSDGAAFGAEHLEIVMNGDLPPAKPCERVLVTIHCTKLTRVLCLQQAFVQKPVLVGQPWSFCGRNRDQKKIQTQGKKPTEAACF